jgi:hypothetical protein
VIAKFRAWLVAQPELMAALPDLCGRDLTGSCAPELCHADVFSKWRSVSDGDLIDEILARARARPVRLAGTVEPPATAAP